VYHTRFPKEVHLPYWARRDNKVTKGDRVEDEVTVVKLKLPLSLTKRYATKAYGEVKIQPSIEPQHQIERSALFRGPFIRYPLGSLGGRRKQSERCGMSVFRKSLYHWMLHNNLERVVNKLRSAKYFKLYSAECSDSYGIVTQQLESLRWLACVALDIWQRSARKWFMSNVCE